MTEYDYSNRTLYGAREVVIPVTPPVDVASLVPTQESLPLDEADE